jgi:hypothetical protein
MWSRFRREHQWQIRELLLTLKLLGRNASAVAGCIIIASMVFMAAFASVLSPTIPSDQPGGAPQAPLGRPSLWHG